MILCKIQYQGEEDGRQDADVPVGTERSTRICTRFSTRERRMGGRMLMYLLGQKVAHDFAQDSEMWAPMRTENSTQFCSRFNTTERTGDTDTDVPVRTESST